MELLIKLVANQNVVAAAEVPSNDFGYLSHESSRWEIAFPFVALGFLLAFCGLATWVVAGRLSKWCGTRWFIFAISALVPLLIFAVLYLAVSIASGAESIQDIIFGVARFQPEAYVLLAGMIWVGILATSLRIARYNKASKNDVQERLDAFR